MGLVLRRKERETIVIGGNITVAVASIDNNEVALLIDAPQGVRIVKGDDMQPPRLHPCFKPIPPAKDNKDQSR